MIPTRALWRSAFDLMAADTTKLASATAQKMHLAKNAFTPSLDLLLAGLTEATFVGSAAKLAGIGTQQVFFNVATGFWNIQILEPAGGWTWTCTTAPGTPETIFGIYLTDNTSAILYGSLLLPGPITIQSIGDSIVVGGTTLSFPTTSPF